MPFFQYFCCDSYVTRHERLSKTILQCPVEGSDKRGRQRKSWIDTIKDKTENIHAKSSEKQSSIGQRGEWRHILLFSSLPGDGKSHEIINGDDDSDVSFFCSEVSPTTEEVTRLIMMLIVMSASFVLKSSQ